jgi:hypothetical protein
MNFKVHPLYFYGACMIRIGYHLVDHCNLNCAGCNHFSPLAEERYASLELFEKNLKRLTKLLDVMEFNLVGGEPLLHPQIEDFIKIARKYIKKRINIITNGILLKNKNNSFYNTVNENHVNILISDYNLNISGNTLIDKSMFKMNYISDFCDKSISCCPFSRKDKCMFLNEYGLLYKCHIIGNIFNYEKKYNKFFDVIAYDDFINIFEDINKLDLMKFILLTPHFCGYCREGVLSSWKSFDKNDWRYDENINNNSYVEC